MASEQDYEREGMLDGLTGDARAQRVELLDDLVSAGIGIAELREALADGRLALLATEHALAGEGRLSHAEIAERSGVPIEFLADQRRALGLIVPEPDEQVLGQEDLEMAHRLKVFLEAGLEPASLAQLVRVMSLVMSQFAAAGREVIAPLFPAEETSELEVSRNLEAMTRELIPLIGPSLAYVYRLQLREQLRHVAFGAAEQEGGETMSVAFADLVGFTRLGETLPPERLGHLTGRFGELASDVAAGPVRLVKLIGDAAMLSASDTSALLEAVLDLVGRAEQEDEEFPELRAGVASGPVLSRGGDLYGGTVNLASRVTGVARPGSVLVTEQVVEALGGDDGYRFSDAGHKRLKGIKSPPRLFRCRRREGIADG